MLPTFLAPERASVDCSQLGKFRRSTYYRVSERVTLPGAMHSCIAPGDRLRHSTRRLVPGLFPVHLGIALQQLRTIWRGDVFSLPNRSHEIVEGIGVHVCPPSVVLSKWEELLPCPPIAQPRVLETKSREVTCLKLAPGESFVHRCPASLVL